MKKICVGIAMITTLCVSASIGRAQDQASGEKTFKAKCAGCHGADGVGNTPAGKATKVRDFQGPEVQKETDTELAEIIANGKNKMPKYSDKLKESEIKELVAYVRMLEKK